MTRDLEAEDPVFRAISEFRHTMDLLFDEQILRASLVRDTGELGDGALAVFDPGSGERSWSTILHLGPGGSRTRGSARPSAADRTGAPAGNNRRTGNKANFADPGNKGVPERDEEDPRERLDALARHLDDRLRRARDSVGGDRPRPDPAG
ncbi:MAG TPA: hypothetical protein VGZ22_12980 [Isosphaeraceae bacterium]|jgi:hypothetical protein|nr:hypothetical protein [Isosphaeraceae bacterium]